ncbi:MAG: hypothetical protein IPP93_01695 [Chitinophagaceae bacterium]|nr:hypothetical protein [Chitinophagaceae bacterium]
MDQILYAVGASFKNVGGNTNQGMVFMFNDHSFLPNFYDSTAIASDGNASDFFGNSMSFDPMNTGYIAIGAYNKENGANATQGQVYLFKDTATGTGTKFWKQIDKFTAPDGVAGDHFGSCVDWQGLDLLIGASNRDETVTDAGAVYVFKKIPFQEGGFRFQKKITDAVPQASQMMGKAISHDATKYVFGLPDWDAPLKIDGGRIMIGNIYQ